MENGIPGGGRGILFSLQGSVRSNPPGQCRRPGLGIDEADPRAQLRVCRDQPLAPGLPREAVATGRRCDASTVNWLEEPRRSFPLFPNFGIP
jgi:hypothetical protein